MVKNILGFFNEYEFLSNFYHSPFNFCGTTFLTNEHFFQAAKATNIDDFLEVVSRSTPREAKISGRKIICRPDWHSIKINVMSMGLRLKFQDPELREKLLATENWYLEETNTWNDTFWGVCNNVGYNYLGNLLMDLRTQIRKEEML